MRSVLLILLSTCYGMFSACQNVGINCTNPTATLDVRDGTFALSHQMNGWVKVHQWEYWPAFQALVFSEDGVPRLSVKDGGNVGIGTFSPTEKLDINGITNFRNNIKVKGVSGQPGQVLGVNESNQLAWMPINGGGNGAADNMDVLYYQGSNTTGEWTVPDGVTKITAEIWGAGGGGKLFKGGGSGGYLKVVLSVSPGETVSYSIGGPGAAAGGAGGPSSITYNNQTFTATGGTAITGTGTLGIPEVGGEGGGFTIPAGFTKALGVHGEDGIPVEFGYVQYASYYARTDHGGHGGNSPCWEGKTGGKGTSFISGEGNVNRHARSTSGKAPGGGGGGGLYGGETGGAGMVIFRY